MRSAYQQGVAGAMTLLGVKQASLLQSLGLGAGVAARDAWLQRTNGETKQADFTTSAATGAAIGAGYGALTGQPILDSTRRGTLGGLGSLGGRYVGAEGGALVGALPGLALQNRALAARGAELGELVGPVVGSLTGGIAGWNL